MLSLNVTWQPGKFGLCVGGSAWWGLRGISNSFLCPVDHHHMTDLHDKKFCRTTKTIIKIKNNTFRRRITQNSSKHFHRRSKYSVVAFTEKSDIARGHSVTSSKATNHTRVKIFCTLIQTTKNTRYKDQNTKMSLRFTLVRPIPQTPRHRRGLSYQK